VAAVLGAPPPLISSASVSTVIRHAAALSSLSPLRITNDPPLPPEAVRTHDPSTFGGG